MNHENKYGIMNHKNKMVRLKIIMEKVMKNQIRNGMEKIQSIKEYQIFD